MRDTHLVLYGSLSRQKKKFVNHVVKHKLKTKHDDLFCELGL